jgi:hypothetical protein
MTRITVARSSGTSRRTCGRATATHSAATARRRSTGATSVRHVVAFVATLASTSTFVNVTALRLGRLITSR